MLSVIIPALNEADTIAATLQALQSMRANGHEVIVVDGGSRDATRELAQPLADRVFDAARGRAAQMNAGAAVARGDILWFVHADTRVPAGAAPAIVDALSRSAGWGRFDVRLSGSRPALRVVESLMNMRSRLTGIATGDQGIFVSRSLFEQVGGFADIPLMEDVELCKRLKRRLAPICLRERLVTSSRRWEQQGVLKTIALMWYLRLAFFFGKSPRRLAAHYD